VKEVTLTEKQKKILHGKLCQYCLVETELKTDKWGYFYQCPKCGAYVGCHKGTKKSLGRTANKELRALKMKAHDHFDFMWKKKKMGRSIAYAWLSEMLEIPKEYTHIGMFSEQTCKRVIDICIKELKK